MISGRTSHQCKKFYFSCKKKLKLDAIVEEFNKVRMRVFFKLGQCCSGLTRWRVLTFMSLYYKENVSNWVN